LKHAIPHTGRLEVIGKEEVVGGGQDHGEAGGGAGGEGGEEVLHGGVVTKYLEKNKRQSQIKRNFNRFYLCLI
jgi:hypothetical protein